MEIIYVVSFGKKKPVTERVTLGRM